MVEGSTDDHTTTNKGVNVHSEALPARVHTYAESDTSTSFPSSMEPLPRSYADIRNEIQTVLDLMGPSTPLVSTSQNTSSEADNEESIMSVPPPRSEASTSSRERKSQSTDKSVYSTKNLTSPEASKSSGRSRSPRRPKDSEVMVNSVMADVGTFSTTNNFESFEEFERSCCDHRPSYVSPPECMCVVGHAKHSAQTNSLRRPRSRTCEGNFSSPKSTAECKKRNLLEWLKTRSYDLVKKSNPNPVDLYKINICGRECEGVPPKRVIFDLVEGIPKPSSSTVATNTVRNPVEKYKGRRSAKLENSLNNFKDMKNITNETITTHQGPNRLQRNIYFDSDGNTRVDFYYFDHGNAQYFHTTDTPPVMKCEILAEKTERYTTKFWAEFFASIHIVVSFCVSFILQLFKFLLYSIIRPLAVGLMQMASDYWLKPFLTTCFNGLIQPFLIFLYNIATSVRDLCDPIAEAFGYFCRELAVLFRAIRLCTYKKNEKDNVDCGCEKVKCEC